MKQPGKTYLCRICLDEEETRATMVAPCDCKGACCDDVCEIKDAGLAHIYITGTSKYVHIECLNRWIRSRRGSAYGAYTLVPLMQAYSCTVLPCYAAVYWEFSIALERAQALVSNYMY